jgi:hypothetical protein
MPEESCRSGGGRFASRDDSRSGPLDGDHDRVVAPVAAGGLAPRGTSGWEFDLLMAAVVAAPDAPQRGDRKSCELVSSRCILFAFVVLSIFLELIFPSGPLCLLVVAVEVRPPCSGQGASPGGGDIQSERLQRRGGAPRARHGTRNVRSPSAIETITASRGGRRGSMTSPPMKTRHQSHREAC